MFCKINKFILYMRVWELLMEILEKVGIDLKVFGLYSLGSGGVIVIVEKNVLDCFIKIYGWWKIDYFRENYIKDFVDKKLNSILIEWI